MVSGSIESAKLSVGVPFLGSVVVPVLFPSESEREQAHGLFVSLLAELGPDFIYNAWQIFGLESIKQAVNDTKSEIAEKKHKLESNNASQESVKLTLEHDKILLGRLEDLKAEGKESIPSTLQGDRLKPALKRMLDSWHRTQATLDSVKENLAAARDGNGTLAGKVQTVKNKLNPLFRKVEDFINSEETDDPELVKELEKAYYDFISEDIYAISVSLGCPPDVFFSPMVEAEDSKFREGLKWANPERAKPENSASTTTKIGALGSSLSVGLQFRRSIHSETDALFGVSQELRQTLQKAAELRQGSLTPKDFLVDVAKEISPPDTEKDLGFSDRLLVQSKKFTSPPLKSIERYFEDKSCHSVNHVVVAISRKARNLGRLDPREQADKVEEFIDDLFDYYLAVQDGLGALQEAIPVVGALYPEKAAAANTAYNQIIEKRSYDMAAYFSGQNPSPTSARAALKGLGVNPPAAPKDPNGLRVAYSRRS